MAEFLRTWGGLIVAGVALIQPWAIATWSRFLRRGNIHIFQTGTLEIGFSQLGPTIGVNGTLKAEHRDLFVEKVDVEIIRQKDSSRHRFEWSLLRGHQVTIAQPQNVTVEIASGFMLRPAQPHRYSILFTDLAAQEEINSLLYPVAHAWQQSRNRAMAQGSQPSPGPAEAAALSVQQAYDEFARTSEFNDAWSKIGRVCYWEPGRYSIVVTVYTFKPDRQFQRKWSFELTPEESEMLRRNVLSILGFGCGFQDWTWNFAFPKYQDAQTAR